MEHELSEFAGYDAGWRLGTFDKCNGKPPLDMTQYPETAFNVGFAEGYTDAYTTNENAFA